MSTPPDARRVAELYARPLLIFDLDGTLIDTIVDLTVALNLALYDHRLPAIGRDLVRSSLHGGLEASAQAALRAAGASLNRYPALVESYRAHYRAVSGKFSRPYRTVPSTLFSLHSRGARLAVCSNKAETEARELLERKGLDGFFEIVVGADTFKARKPDPEPLLGAIARLGGMASDAVFTGDSQVDVDCARAAGVDCVFFNGGYGDCAQPVGARFSTWPEIAIALQESCPT